MFLDIIDLLEMYQSDANVEARSFFAWFEIWYKKKFLPKVILYTIRGLLGSTVV